ncbi:MAG: hypothetical protein HYV13_01330 [Candidatus Doudnabacteria bacterium]|nr:hypothetical protein [Candidatus Doudnabacteria bacterium]
MTIAMLVFLLGLASSGIVSAQTLPDRFSSRAECLAALKSGRYRAYVPSFLTLKREPTAGEEVRPLEANACMRMHIVGTRRLWVVQMAGTEFIFRAGQPVARYDCGNEVYETAYLPEPVAIRLPPPPPPPTQTFTPPPAIPELPPLPPVRRFPLPPTYQEPPDEDEDLEFVWDISPGVIGGPVRGDFRYPDPRRGDAPWRHRFFASVIKARAEMLTPDHNAGFFASLITTFSGEASKPEFQNIRGEWNRKRREADDSRDKFTDVKFGVKLPVGNIVSVGVGADYNRICFCQLYLAQNARSEDRRRFSTWGLGVEAVGATEGRGLVARAGGVLGLAGDRRRSFKQFYHSPPAIDFPPVTDPKEDAKRHELAASVELGIAFGANEADPAFVLKPFLGVTWSNWKSFRPNTHPATEFTTLLGWNGGLGFSF